MTVMAIPEAAGAVEAAGSRVVQGRVVGGSTYDTYNTRRVGSRTRARASRTAGARARSTSAAKQYGAQAAGAYAGTARGAARQARDASIPGDRSYQPVILAEFLIAVVLVAMTPIATGGSPNAKAKGSPSPYDVGDLRQLVAVGAVYFVLSLISSGNRGRISAWLGGLIVIGIAMTKLSKGQLTSLVTGITGISSSSPPSSTDTTTGGGGSKNPEAA